MTERRDENGCRITTCIDKDGRIFEYVLVKDRVKRFWEMFPIALGWSVSRTVTAYPFSEAKIEMFRLCIEKGVNPEEFGISFPESQVAVVAQLIDKDQIVRASATSFGHVGMLKDIETTETAAFGRLMAMVGLPGSPGELDDGTVVYDGDSSKEAACQVPAATRQPPRKVSAVAQAPSKTPPSPAPAQKPGFTLKDEHKEESVAAPSVAAPAAPAVQASQEATEERVPLALVTQIRGVAAHLGVDPPPYAGIAQAKAVLENLRARGASQ